MVVFNQSQSENIQMYLVTIYRMRERESPVPVPLLVEEMGLTPASINEMCRKLEKEHLLNYVPYSGVILTEKGEKLARNIIRKHRLWEVFLVGKLGFDFEEAHEISCQLEHYTQDDLANRLEGFLEQPQVNPRGEPIPPWSKTVSKGNFVVPLLGLSTGDEAKITHLDGEKIEIGYLLKNEIKPGEEVQVMAVDDTSMLILIRGEHLVLSHELAEKVYVQPIVE